MTKISEQRGPAQVAAWWRGGREPQYGGAGLAGEVLPPHWGDQILLRQMFEQHVAPWRHERDVALHGPGMGRPQIDHHICVGFGGDEAGLGAGAQWA